MTNGGGLLLIAGEARHNHWLRVKISIKSLALGSHRENDSRGAFPLQ